MLDTINGVTFFGNKPLFHLDLSDLREVESFITQQVIQDHAELENPSNTELVKGFIRSRITRGEHELIEVRAAITESADTTFI